MTADNHSTLKEQVALLPLDPGVYQFLDSSGKVIYVGKAKSLRKRVSSYFVQSKEHSAKVRIMVRHIVEIRHIVVESETDALLLENSLIKSLQPRYNILLKDDKSYPWIVVRNEPCPRIESTRRLVRDGSLYFGPYGSVAMQHTILEFIREVIPLRTCKFNLSPEKVAKGSYQACMQYYLGNCNAPCIGAQSAEEYAQHVEMAKSVLKGDLRPVRTYLEENMYRASDEWRFEQAHRFKLKLEALEKYRSHSVIVSARVIDVDVFSLITDEADNTAYCNYIRIRHGSVTGVYTVRLTAGAESTEAEMLTIGIQHIVENIAGELTREVIVPFLPSTTILFDKVIFTIPQRGEKLNLLKFSEKSARIYRAEHLKNIEIKNPERHTDRLMETMKRELHLRHEPRHIECFDNSNLQGTYPVASCVVFRDGKPSRKEYRHFNIKTVVGADDFASMREIVGRRYRRMLAEGAQLPDLIIVDGGKGQLSSAYAVLCELGIEHKVEIVGLAKRIEEIFFPHDPTPYYLSRTGEPLKVVCHIRDEAHRFGISFHRDKRSNGFLHSYLENIHGIGKKSIEALFRKFRTISHLRNATEAEIAEVVGASRARLVVEWLKSGDE